MSSKAFLSVVFAVLVAIGGAISSNSTGVSPCTSPLGERHEWRSLNETQKLDYINAVKCLQSLPSTGLVKKEAKTRYDDFMASHIVLSDEVHHVGQFLPWHRYFLHLYERALHDECGYRGMNPYWNWTLDITQGIDSFVASPVFDPVYGFGGNGEDIPGYQGQFGNFSAIPGWSTETTTGGGCVLDGPFASYNLSLGPGPILNLERCLSRSFSSAFLFTFTKEQVANATRLPTFELFRIELEGRTVTPTAKPHDGMHYTLGGDMRNTYSSPADPLFYLHHSTIDKIWWDWQMADPDNRLHDISGRTTIDPPYQNLTLDFPLKNAGLAPLTESVASVMDLRNELLCYSYV
ncbi:hypothetical protein V5O48_012473 [Marasmius crinis-equi]|uniref:Tyrosinase copper-binding domain-containing protein n=1 Tax=Marasmius crinis-equi TaxID=585013 RepID=A0ABR3F3B6_9AGAR